MSAKTRWGPPYPGIDHDVETVIVSPKVGSLHAVMMPLSPVLDLPTNFKVSGNDARRYFIFGIKFRFLGGKKFRPCNSFL